MDSDGIIIKEAIKKNIKNSIDNFLNDDYLNNLLKILKIDEKELLNINYIKYIYAEKPLNLINMLDIPIKELKNIGITNEGLIKLEKEYNFLIEFINNKMFIHYIFIGAYSSGKSFTLNNMIGGYNYELLETGRKETTKHAFIIRNSKEINLYEAEVEKSKYGYFIKKAKKLASGKDEVINQIIYVNDNIMKLSFYILETPIHMFENISISESIINRIEIIDFPGLDTEGANKRNYTDNFLFNKDMIDGIFFINEPKSLDENSVKSVFENITNKFLYSDSKIDYMKNCLFLFTKNNLKEQLDFYDLDISKLILSLIEDLKKENKKDYTDILKIESKINSSLINFAKFSNIDYRNYLILEESLQSFDKFVSIIIKEIKITSKKKNLKQLFNLFDSYIIDKYELKPKEDENNGIFWKIVNVFQREKKRKKL